MITIDIEKDIDSLMRWRREVIEHVFEVEPSEQLMDANRRYYVKHIADGSHIAVVAKLDGQEAGCGSICLSSELPSPDNENGLCAYLMNIYVRDPFRGQGIAHAIINRLVADAKALNCKKIYLETTPEARRVYESVGFHEMVDMMKL